MTDNLNLQEYTEQSTPYLDSMRQTILYGIFAKPKQLIKANTGFQRNKKCPCGSGEKFKRCCLNKNET